MGGSGILLPPPIVLVQAWSAAAFGLLLAALLLRGRRDVGRPAILAILIGNAVFQAMDPFVPNDRFPEGGELLIVALARVADVATIVGLVLLPWLASGRGAGGWLRAAVAGLLLVSVAATVLITVDNAVWRGSPPPGGRAWEYNLGTVAFGTFPWLVVAAGLVRLDWLTRNAATAAASSSWRILAIAYGIKVGISLPTTIRVGMPSDTFFLLQFIALAVGGIGLGAATGWVLSRGLRRNHPSLGIAAATVGAVVVGAIVWTWPDQLAWLFSAEHTLVRPLLLTYGVMRWHILDVGEGQARAIAVLLVGAGSLAMGAAVARLAAPLETGYEVGLGIAAGLASMAGLAVAVPSLLARRRWGTAEDAPKGLPPDLRIGRLFHRSPTAAVAAARWEGRRIVVKWPVGDRGKLEAERVAASALAGRQIMPVQSVAGALVMPRLPPLRWPRRHEASLASLLSHLRGRRWVHGDLHKRNLYVDRGAVVAGDLAIARRQGTSWAGAVGHGMAATANQRALGRARFADDEEAVARLLRRKS